MKSILSYSIILLSLTFLSMSSSSTKVKWVKYQHSNTGIRASFPGSFNEEVEPDQEGYKTTKASCESNNVFYFLGITEHKLDLVDIDELEEVSLNSFTETTQGTIVERKNWKYKKEEGIEGKIDIESSEILYRVIIIGQEQIQQVIAYPKEYEPTEKVIKKFFKSLKV